MMSYLRAHTTSPVRIYDIYNIYIYKGICVHTYIGEIMMMVRHIILLHAYIQKCLIFCKVRMVECRRKSAKYLALLMGEEVCQLDNFVRPRC